MNIETVNEMGESYLKIDCDETKVNSYEMKITTTNKISGLLSCSKRTINGENFFFYSIKGLQSLQKLDKFNHIGTRDILTFFFQVKNLYTELQRFLLDGNKLMINAQHIYYDMDTDKYFFLYYPSDNTSEREGFMQLLELFMERIDNQDTGAVECIYGAYQKVMCENFSVCDMLEFVCDFPMRQKERERQEREEELHFSECRLENNTENNMESMESNTEKDTKEDTKANPGENTGEDMGALGITYIWTADIILLIMGCFLVFCNPENYSYRLTGAAMTVVSFLLLAFFSIKLTPARS